MGKYIISWKNQFKTDGYIFVATFFGNNIVFHVFFTTLLPTKQLWKKCLSWRLKRVWCNEKSTLFLWRQELCHLPIILYPLQYMKQKSRNVVQEITIIKTCQQSKLHCKTINDRIRARKFKFFQIEIKALKMKFPRFLTDKEKTQKSTGNSILTNVMLIS